MDDRDKRDYYRLNDSILVDYKLVAQTDVQNASAGDFFTSDPNFHLLRDIYELQLESKQLLHRISNENKDLGKFLGNFLGNLDQRVELIAKSAINADLANLSMKSCDAEISEGGLSFLSPTLINTDQSLAIRLLLQPSFLGLTSFAQVKHCQLQENEYRIGVQFVGSDLQTQRLISRHIISKQAEQRRSRLNRSS